MRSHQSASVSDRYGRSVCLTLMVLAALPWQSVGAPRWCSPFETEAGAPVTEGQVAGSVENAVGDPGQAAAGLATLDPMLYVQHGAFVPPIPVSIDPAGQAGSFAISTPDHRSTAINTNLRSDAGNLATQLTAEGYFYMPDPTAVLAPTYVGRRLFTQKRSALDDNSRLAIGVHAANIGFADGLFEYEGFNYSGSEPVLLAGQGGGMGWGGAWVNSANDYLVFAESLTTPVSPITPVGGRVVGVGGAQKVATRPLARKVDLSMDGNVLFFSVLMRKNSNVTGSNVEINFTPASTGTQTTRFGMTSTGEWFLNVSTNKAGVVELDVTYLVIGKIASSAGANDQVAMAVYGPDDTLPDAEPEDWLLTSEINSNVLLENIRLVVGAGTQGEFDEIRIGSTYESVIDPDAGTGAPGELRNLLSVYWAEEVVTPGPLPEDPPVITYANHLEFGTTPLEAATWYHFALTYDGMDLRWYLNGQLEGHVSNPPIANVGTAKMVLANNRMTAGTDRGFYGVLDEIRIWDKVLTPSEMLVNGGLPGPNLLWQSRFETQLGEPVTSGMVADKINCIDNAIGHPNGSPAGIVASVYTALGQSGAPAVPAAIDPSGLTGSFALSQPDAPNPAINTGIPSNAGDFASALTAQGYFYSRATMPVTVASVGQRFVSTMRSNQEGQARLAIGLAANVDAPETPTHNVLAVIWSNPASVLTVVRGTTPIQPDTWYHFAMVWDGTDIRFYLNGVLEGEVLAPDLIAPGTAPIAVGNDRTNGAGTRGFYGLLDKIVISDHVIAPTEFMTAGFDPCLGVWCNMPFADADDNGVVDMLDFAIVQRCIALSGETLDSQCACFDRDLDSDIDLLDLSEFAKCATGPGVTWSLDLAPDCDPQ
ncbi:MAG TPA: LamG domain-containing protein [Phycisphaerae bacterium]|nr:LamG domain-containing protein [Phycisphaerae bacterium]